MAAGDNSAFAGSFVSLARTAAYLAARSADPAGAALIGCHGNPCRCAAAVARAPRLDLCGRLELRGIARERLAQLIDIADFDVGLRERNANTRLRKGMIDRDRRVGARPDRLGDIVDIDIDIEGEVVARAAER